MPRRSWMPRREWQGAASTELKTPQITRMQTSTALSDSHTSAASVFFVLPRLPSDSPEMVGLSNNIACLDSGTKTRLSWSDFWADFWADSRTESSTKRYCPTSRAL